MWVLKFIVFGKKENMLFMTVPFSNSHFNLESCFLERILLFINGVDSPLFNIQILKEDIIFIYKFINIFQEKNKKDHVFNTLRFSKVY